MLALISLSFFAAAIPLWNRDLEHIHGPNKGDWQDGVPIAPVRRPSPLLLHFRSGLALMLIVGGGIPIQRLYQYIRHANGQTSPLHLGADYRLSDLGHTRPCAGIRNLGRRLQCLADSDDNHGSELVGDGGDVRCVHELLE